MAKIAAFAFGFFAFVLANLVRCAPAQTRFFFAGALGWTPSYQRLPSGPLATRIIVLEAASIVRPSKERAISASSSSDIAKVTRPTEDFLFGNDKGLIIIKRYRHALNLAR